MKEMIKDLKGLLSIPSVLDKYDSNCKEYPFGKEIKKALDYMKVLALRDNLKFVNIDNYVAYIEYGEGEEMIAMLGHLDVVPATGKWTNKPFSPIMIDDKLYARGVLDDKGPVMAAYYVLKYLIDNNVKTNKRIRLILGCDEESGMRCMKRYLETEEIPCFAFAPDAEFPLIHGEKSISSYDLFGETKDENIISIKAGDRYNVVPDYLEAILNVDLKKEFLLYLKDNSYQGEIIENKYIIKGISAHAMEPSAGVNAIILMARFLNEYMDNVFIKYICTYLDDTDGKQLCVKSYDKIMKHLTMNVANINYEKNKFKIGINFRMPKESNNDLVKKRFKETIKDFSFKNIDYHPLHLVSANDVYVKILMDVYKSITNDYKAVPLTIGGGTYARVFPKAVAYGPLFLGRVETAHQVDEHMYVSDIIKSYEIYKEAILRLST